jgi:DNA-binding HxlR family transcriptional regulator
MKSQRGSTPKNLFPIKELILQELESEPKRWRELWNNPDLRELARSKEILSRALTELDSLGFIKQTDVSYKVKPYYITEKGSSLIEARRRLDYYLEFLELEKNRTFKEDEVLLMNNAFKVFVSVIAEVVSLDEDSRGMIEPWVNGELLRNLIELVSYLKTRNPDILKKLDFHEPM